jgi:hypothetical protein
MSYQVWRLVFLFVGSVAFFSNEPAEANDKSDSASVALATNAGTSNTAPVGSSGLELAQRHLPQLLPLLNYLRTNEPAQYEKAVRDLDRAAKRLEAQQRRGDEFHDLALRQWQTRGRIDLLKAKLKVRPSDSDRKRLLVEMQLAREIEVERLRLESEALAERQRVLSARVTQAEVAVKRASEQMDELNQTIQRLSSQKIDADWPAYRRAAGLERDTDNTKKSNSLENSKPAQGAKASDRENGSSL